MTTNYLSLPKDSDLIELNCLGTIFVVRQTSLNRFPKTLLGDPKRRATFYNKTRDQYLIDRHIVSFEAILFYYETGKLFAPMIYEPMIFLEELKYFQFDSETIERFYQNEIHDEFLSEQRIVPSKKIFRSIWIALEFDDFPLIRFVLLIISLIFCLNISIEFIPQISREKHICHRSSNDCDEYFFDFRPSKTRGKTIVKIEQICTVLISIEYLLRLVVSPKKWLTLTSLINLIDLLILFGSWTYLILVDLNLYHDEQYDPFFYLKFFQFLALIRLFRFIRLCRYIKSLRILFLGVERAMNQIFSIGFIILFFVLTFGIAIEIIEKNIDRSFVTRLEDLFNIVTISTITVGDAKRVPLSAWGKILCSILAAIGLIGISLPLPSIYRTFQQTIREENIRYVPNVRRTLSEKKI